MFTVKKIVIPGAGDSQQYQFSGCTIECISHDVPVFDPRNTASIKIGDGSEIPLTLGSVYSGRNSESFDRFEIKGSQMTAGAVVYLAISDQYREPDLQTDPIGYKHKILPGDFDPSNNPLTNPSQFAYLYLIPYGRWKFHSLFVRMDTASSSFPVNTANISYVTYEYFLPASGKWEFQTGGEIDTISSLLSAGYSGWIDIYFSVEVEQVEFKANTQTPTLHIPMVPYWMKWFDGTNVPPPGAHQFDSTNLGQIIDYRLTIEEW